MQCGGTCFDAPTKHANKNKNKFDGYIIVTDGMAPKPEHSRLKRGWVISSGMTLNFDTQKSDIVINLK
jgi:predicted metal-dependent peptidase